MPSEAVGRIGVARSTSILPGKARAGGEVVAASQRTKVLAGVAAGMVPSSAIVTKTHNPNPYPK